MSTYDSLHTTLLENRFLVYFLSCLHKVITFFLLLRTQTKHRWFVHNKFTQGGSLQPPYITLIHYFLLCLHYVYKVLKFQPHLKT